MGKTVVRRRVGFGVATAFVAIVYLLNASWLAPAPAGTATLLAHRGVYQRYNREGLGRDDCTATRMLPPTHALLENTIPSMRAGFAAGARDRCIERLRDGAKLIRSGRSGAAAFRPCDHPRQSPTD